MNNTESMPSYGSMQFVSVWQEHVHGLGWFVYKEILASIKSSSRQRYAFNQHFELYIREHKIDNHEKVNTTLPPVNFRFHFG